MLPTAGAQDLVRDVVHWRCLQLRSPASMWAQSICQTAYYEVQQVSRWLGKRTEQWGLHSILIFSMSNLYKHKMEA